MEPLTAPITRHNFYRSPIFWLRFAAYAIPLALLLYVLYYNFMPFGFSDNQTIVVGSDNDTSGSFYLEPSRDLSERLTTASGTPYRTLNGLALATYKPKAVLKNAHVTVSVESLSSTTDPSLLSILPPYIDFDPSTVPHWDRFWNFSTSTPADFTGDAYYFDGCTYFDGHSKLDLPASSNIFETGPFSVYADWTPKDGAHDFQEIIGHYNWELLQNRSSVSFQVGRMNDAKGPFYSVKYPVGPSFFDTEHTAIAIYAPATAAIPASTTTPAVAAQAIGYIDLFVDGNFAGRTFIGKDIIWRGYNEKRNLSLGWSSHNEDKNPYYQGCLYEADFVKQIVVTSSQNFSLTSSDNQLSFPVISGASTTINTLKINVE